MIDYETFARIRHLHDQKGLTATQIARELGHDERTVKRCLAAKQFQPRKSVRRPSILDPFKDTVVRMIESYSYSAQQVYQRLREEGFTGGYTVVKKLVRKVRPRWEKAYLTLAFAPGECAQVDWGAYGSIRVGGSTRRFSATNGKQPLLLQTGPIKSGRRSSTTIARLPLLFLIASCITPKPWLSKGQVTE